jgi:hypothetical protein
MSKHVHQKMNQYTTELNPDVMKCMAGFSKEEDYFVPHSELPLPEWICSEDLTGTIFPAYDRWMHEESSPFHDSSEETAVAY